MVSIGSAEFLVEINRQSVTQAINQVERQFAQVGPLDLDINLGANAAQQARDVANTLGRIRTPDLDLDIDTGRIRQSFRQIDRQLDGLDDAGRQAAREINRELRRIQSPKITPELDIRAFRGFGGVVTGIFQGVGQEITQQLTRAIGGGIRAGFGALQDAAGFESALVQFQSRAQGAADVTAAVADEARRLGIETSKTPEEVARIGTRMVELGGDISDVRDNLSGVVSALEGTGFTNLDATARAIQAGTNVFGESADEFADKITLLANTTAVTSGEAILQALSKAGGAFISADQDASVLLATFAKFSETSTPQVAATATRNALQKLTPTSEKAREALEKLNLRAFEGGRPREFLDILDDLKSGLDALPTDEDRTQALIDVFGRESASQIQILVQGLDDVRGKTDELRNSLGAAGEASANLNQGVSAALNRLQGTLTTAGTDFGLSLGPALEAGIRGLTGSINSAIADGDAFADTTASVQRLLDTVDGADAIDKFGAAFRSLFDSIDDSAAAIIDSIAQTLSDPGNIDRFAEGIENIGRLLAATVDIGLLAADAFLAISFAANDILGDTPLDLLEKFLNLIDEVGYAAKGTAITLGEIEESIDSVGGPIPGLLDGLQNIARFGIGIGVIKTVVEEVIEALDRLGISANDAIEVVLDVASLIPGGQLIAQTIDQLTQFRLAAGEEVELAPINAPSLPDFSGGVEGINALNEAFNRVGLADPVDDKEARLRAAAELEAQLGEEGVDGVRQSEIEKNRIREEALDELESLQSAALTRIATEESNQIRAIREAQLGGRRTEDDADSAVADVEIQAIQQRIAAANKEADELARLRDEGLLDEEEAAKQIAAAKQEVSELSLQGIEREISAQEQARKAVEDRAKEEEEAQKKAEKAIKDRIEAELSGRERINQLSAQVVNIGAEINTTGLQQQLDISQAQASVEQGRLQVSRQLLEARLGEAEAVENVARAEELRDSLLLNQLQLVESETSARERQIQGQRQLLQLDAQRQSSLASIAESEAQIALERAQASDNSSDEELRLLQAIVEARGQETEQIKQQLTAQLNKLDIEAESLDIQDEQARNAAILERRQSAIDSAIERQNDLLRDQEKLEKDITSEVERRQNAIDGIVSSLSGLEDVSSEQSLEGLDRLEENLRAVSRTGFEIPGIQDLRSAIDQAQRLASSGGEFSIEEGFRFAQRNADNQFASSVLDIAGLGGISSVLDAEQEFKLADNQIEQLTTKLDEVKETIKESFPDTIENTFNIGETVDPLEQVAQVTAAVARGARG